jgi:hypothetical protein
MRSCPEIDALVERPAHPSVVEHCRRCAACDAIALLAELRHASCSDDAACIAEEIAIAQAIQSEGAHAASSRDHLEQCAACSETAVRVRAFGPLEAETTELVQLSAPARAPSRRRLLGLLAAAGLAAAMVGGIALRVAEESDELAAEPESQREPEPEPARHFEPEPVPAGELVIEANPQSPLRPAPGFISIVCTPVCDDP